MCSNAFIINSDRVDFSPQYVLAAIHNTKHMLSAEPQMCHDNIYSWAQIWDNKFLHGKCLFLPIGYFDQSIVCHLENQPIKKCNTVN